MLHGMPISPARTPLAEGGIAHHLPSNFTHQHRISLLHTTGEIRRALVEGGCALVVDGSCVGYHIVVDGQEGWEIGVHQVADEHDRFSVSSCVLGCASLIVVKCPL